MSESFSLSTEVQGSPGPCGNEPPPQEGGDVRVGRPMKPDEDNFLLVGRKPACFSGSSHIGNVDVDGIFFWQTFLTIFKLTTFKDYLFDGQRRERERERY